MVKGNYIYMCVCNHDIDPFSVKTQAWWKLLKFMSKWLLPGLKYIFFSSIFQFLGWYSLLRVFDNVTTSWDLIVNSNRTEMQVIRVRAFFWQVPWWVERRISCWHLWSCTLHVELSSCYWGRTFEKLELLTFHPHLCKLIGRNEQYGQGQFVSPMYTPLSLSLLQHLLLLLSYPHNPLVLLLPPLLFSPHHSWNCWYYQILVRTEWCVILFRRSLKYTRSLSPFFLPLPNPPWVSSLPWSLNSLLLIFPSNPTFYKHVKPCPNSFLFKGILDVCECIYGRGR